MSSQHKRSAKKREIQRIGMLKSEWLIAWYSAAKIKKRNIITTKGNTKTVFVRCTYLFRKARVQFWETSDIESVSELGQLYLVVPKKVCSVIVDWSTCGFRLRGEWSSWRIWHRRTDRSYLCIYQYLHSKRRIQFCRMQACSEGFGLDIVIFGVITNEVTIIIASWEERYVTTYLYLNPGTCSRGPNSLISSHILSSGVNWQA